MIDTPGYGALGQRGDDVYVGARSILGSKKISLHASGICRVAITEARRQLMVAQGLEAPADRAFVKWRRQPSTETGLTHALSIIFPLNYLQHPAPAGTSKKPLFIFGAPWSDGAVEVALFYTRLAAADIERRFVGGNLLFGWQLDNGESALFAARRKEFDPSILPKPADLRKAGLRPFSRDALPKPGEELNKLTMALFTDPKETGPLRVVEIGGVTLKNEQAS